MELHSDKGRATLALLISKVWENEELKHELLQNPQQVLNREGVEIPAGVSVKVLENTDTVRYLPLTKNFDPAKDRDKAAALITQMLPIPEGKEVRLVQSTTKTYYIVIPAPPSEERRATFMRAHVINMVADAGFQSTWHDTTQTTEAESTEVAVAETTEAIHVETSVAVVAEAAIVLI